MLFEDGIDNNGIIIFALILPFMVYFVKSILSKKQNRFSVLAKQSACKEESLRDLKEKLENISKEYLSLSVNRDMLLVENDSLKKSTN